MLARGEEDVVQDEAEHVFARARMRLTDSAIATSSAAYSCDSRTTPAAFALPAAIEDVPRPEQPEPPRKPHERPEQPEPPRKRRRAPKAKAGASASASSSSANPLFSFLNNHDDDNDDDDFAGECETTAGRPAAAKAKAAPKAAKQSEGLTDTPAPKAKGRAVKGRAQDREFAQSVIDQVGLLVASEITQSTKVQEVKSISKRINKAKLGISKARAGSDSMMPDDLILLEQLVQCEKQCEATEAILMACAVKGKRGASKLTPAELHKTIADGAAVGTKISSEILTVAYDNHCKHALACCMESWRAESKWPTLMAGVCNVVSRATGMSVYYGVTLCTFATHGFDDTHICDMQEP